MAEVRDYFALFDRARWLDELLSQMQMKRPNQVTEPLAGGDVRSVSHPGKGDLFDWVELMEAVEVLCPMWPDREPQVGGVIGGFDEDRK